MIVAGLPAEGYVTVFCASCQDVLWCAGRPGTWSGRECPSVYYTHVCADGNKLPNINILRGVKGGAVQMPLLIDGLFGKVDIGAVETRYGEF